MAAYGIIRRFYQMAAMWLLLAGLLAAPAIAVAAAPAAGGPLILAFGDSLTAGYRLKPGEGFAPQLEAALRQRGIAATVHNAGVSGDTSAQGRARLGWVLSGLKNKPDLAIVALGANDMLRGQPPATTQANLDAIVGELRTRGIPVVVAGMRAAPNMGADYARSYAAIFPAVAKKHGAFLYPFFLAGVAAQPGLLLDDGKHPNPAGVKRMVKNILPTIETALKPPR